MTHSVPAPPSSKELNTTRGGTPPPPEQEKKTGKKLETPVLVAIISAVVTLVASFVGSPLLLTLLDKTETPASTPAAELAISQNSLLPDNFPGAESLKDTSSPSIIEITSTPQEENPGSAPLLLESTSTATIIPPQKPDSPTPAPPSFFLCIAADVWFPYPTTLSPEISAGCWNLAGWGFTTDQGRLSLVPNPVQDQQRGIYTPISGDADIRFSLQLDEFRTRTNKTGFLNFGVVQNDPISIYKGGYLTYQQPTPGAASPVRVLISGSRQATQKISALEAGFQHEVLLSIEDDLMTVYLNGEQAGDPVSLPHTDRAFWIGYVLPSKGELEVMITNFSIQTH